MLNDLDSMALLFVTKSYAFTACII